MSHIDELEAIRRVNGGKLLPRDVVDFARNPNTALHRQFDWDDSKAAEKWRIAQASQIIRAAVTIIPSGTGEPVRVRAYVSLPSDRTGGEGYRSLAEVMHDEAAATEALSMLRAEIDALRVKYSVYESLRTVVEAIVEAAQASPSSPARRRKAA